jgi:hypothetical protein
MRTVCEQIVSMDPWRGASRPFAGVFDLGRLQRSRSPMTAAIRPCCCRLWLSAAHQKVVEQL